MLTVLLYIPLFCLLVFNLLDSLLLSARGSKALIEIPILISSPVMVYFKALVKFTSCVKIRNVCLIVTKCILLHFIERFVLVPANKLVDTVVTGLAFICK